MQVGADYAPARLCFQRFHIFFQLVSLCSRRNAVWAHALMLGLLLLSHTNAVVLEASLLLD